jgi:adenylate kinase family enzyme
VIALEELGDRICIMGPSNSGKSTLADAIARKIGAQAIHLDALYHLPGTDWVPRPYDEFRRLHDDAITSPRWVIDGNYSKLLPQRLSLATGFILLDVSAPLSLYRYIRRSLSSHARIGALEGGQDSVKWSMLKHIVVATPRNRKRYASLYKAVDLSRVRLRTARQIKSCYTEWELAFRREE